MLDIEIKHEQLPVIQINFEEMKQALNEKLGEYKGIVVTDETLSTCKSDQKELSRIRSQIDIYRKDKKKELSKPITTFETQCKQLIGLVEDVEKPIKAGIAVFDDKKREEKRQKAIDIIKQAIQDHNLNEKYGSRLTVLDKYTNLTGSIKSIKEDVEQRCFALVEEQAREEEMLQAIQTTIDSANKDIKTQIKFDDFKGLVNAGFPLPKIIERINQMSEKIKLAEAPKPEPPKEEPKKEEPKIEPTPNSITSNFQAIPIKATPREEIKSEPLYYVTFTITGNVNQTTALGNFLRANNYKYEVLKKGYANEVK